MTEASATICYQNSRRNDSIEGPGQKRLEKKLLGFQEPRSTTDRQGEFGTNFLRLS